MNFDKLLKMKNIVLPFFLLNSSLYTSSFTCSEKFSDKSITKTELDGITTSSSLDKAPIIANSKAKPIKIKTKNANKLAKKDLKN
mgnify:CR=1 FL=1